ncbi:restriction endonuclease [Frigoribacterium sp. CFBP 13605]|uniref:McrC family protein n=1 Tax=Frigoribacterium sp. CFBP 13605 TaxID=2774034 RepID=UPI0019069C1D|nr:restriction endonuclease [Frigoribacterium sp. CFBP 13605]MBD8141197.1 restriction endonuclease [Frigoribacterium sp. CFBP 13605]
MTRLDLPENSGWSPAPFDAEVIERACDTGLLESKITSAGPQVKPQLNRVGAVAVDGHEIVVQPKAPFSSVLFMLGYAADPGFRPDEVDGTGDDLFPAVAETYARLMERALGRGVLQGYRRLDETAVAIRGRIRFSDQMSRRGGQLLPVELTVDDYTVDIAENQLLRAAARLLLTLPRLTKEARHRLVHLESRLVDASLVRPGAGLPSWQPTRLNERYQPAVRFAELILARVAPSTTAGGEAVASFVVNMAEAFEGFVTAALTESFAAVSTGVSVGQYPTHLDRERKQPIRPDFVHLVGGVPAVVVDAKYKIGSLRVEDLYQMLAYCTVLGLDKGTLIYVADTAALPGQRTSIALSTVVVQSVRVDVTLAPRDMVGGLHQFVRSTAEPRVASCEPVH